MFKIISSNELSASVKQLVVEAPLIAHNALPGQFIILRVNERGERIPLTIAGKDPDAGTITIIFQSVGKTTSALFALNSGDHISDILGPLGCPTVISKVGTIIAIGGGVGVAEILPIAHAFKEAGNEVIGIIGARSKELIILENEMRAACDRLMIITDDGSSGTKGFVTDMLNTLVMEGTDIDLVYAIGPVPMMKAVSAITKSLNIKTIVSLNPIMVDATGMCGACRVTVGGKVHFACVDGPEFDGHEVNWEELMTRLSLFKQEEKMSFEQHTKLCQCKKEPE